MSDILRSLLAPFDEARANPATTEIVVNRCGEYGVEADGEWSWHQDSRLDYDHLEAIAIHAAYNSGRDISLAHPLCLTTLPDNERITICRPDATLPGVISFTIRRQPSFRPTVAGLVESGMFDTVLPEEAGEQKLNVPEFDGGLQPYIAQRLTRAVLNRENILISGAVGSGKTTLARALIELIPLTKRLITIAAAEEWQDIPHRNRVSLLYADGGQGTSHIKAEDLLKFSLSMRPDRVLIQELKDGAAFTYLRSVVAGHPGSIATLHANSARGAFDSLRLMFRQHPDGKTMDDRDVRAMLEETVDVIVQCQRNDKAMSNRDRYRTTDIYEKGKDDEAHSASLNRVASSRSVANITNATAA